MTATKTKPANTKAANKTASKTSTAKKAEDEKTEEPNVEVVVDDTAASKRLEIEAVDEKRRDDAPDFEEFKAPFEKSTNKLEATVHGGRMFVTIGNQKAVLDSQEILYLGRKLRQATAEV